MQSLPEEFTQRIEGTFGRAGKMWIHDLPVLLKEISQRWSLKLLPPFDNLSYNYVVPVIRKDGAEAVLKLGVPNKELTNEIEALHLLRGRGTVKLFESDRELGALLLERLNPGRPVYELADDEAATSIAAQWMERVWEPAPEGHPFPTVSDWGKGFQRLRNEFEGATGLFPEELVIKAERVFQDLLGSMADSVLLHGDLHHWNILSAEREPWLAIDPKGVVGEPAYEVGAWLRNPFPNILGMDDLQVLIQRRVNQFSERLGFEEERMLKWSFAQAVLAGWWSYEEHAEDWRSWITLAESFVRMF
jgi:streptomycin 6-kinase